MNHLAGSPSHRNAPADRPGEAIAPLLSAIQTFDAYPIASDHIRLDVELPHSLFRHSSPASPRASRQLRFELVYDREVLSAEIPLGTRSHGSKDVAVKCTDEGKCSYRIEHPPTLCFEDARRLLLFLLSHFRGFEVSVSTPRQRGTRITLVGRNA